MEDEKTTAGIIGPGIPIARIPEQPAKRGRGRPAMTPEQRKPKAPQTNLKLDAALTARVKARAGELKMSLAEFYRVAIGNLLDNTSAKTEKAEDET